MNIPTTSLALICIALTSGLVIGNVAQANEGKQAQPELVAYEVPKGWKLQVQLSADLSVSANAAEQFGDKQTSTSATLAWAATNQGAFYLTWSDSVDLDPTPEAHLRIAFDTLHESPYLASPKAGEIKELRYGENAIKGLAEMNFQWSHTVNETITLIRALGWKDAQSRLHMVVAECLLPVGSKEQGNCESAMEAMHLRPVAAPMALSSLAAPSSINALGVEDIDIPELRADLATTLNKGNNNSNGPSLGVPPSEIGEILYEGRTATKKNDDDNRLFIALGLLLLAVAVWTSLRSKKELERSEEQAHDNEEGERDE